MFEPGNIYLGRCYVNCLFDYHQNIICHLQCIVWIKLSFIQQFCLTSLMDVLYVLYVN